MKPAYRTIAVFLYLSVQSTMVVAQAPDLRQMLETFRKGKSQTQQETQKSKSPEPTKAQPTVPDSAPGTGQLPCLSKVCLGDLIFNHSASIEWSDHSKKAHDLLWQTGPSIVELGEKRARVVKQEPPTKRNHPAINDRRGWIDRYVKGLSAEADKDKLAAYLVMERADRSLFDFLATKKPVFCRSVFLVAYFSSESGYSTSVRVAPTAKGEIRIVGLDRYYPNSDPIEARRTREAVAQQFPYLKFNSIGERTPYGGDAGFLPLGSADHLSFTLASTEMDGDNKLARQNGCDSPKGSVD
jgi:hypothetical protein